MRYSIEKEQRVKLLAKQGKSADYISTLTGIPQKVIWSWCPDLRPHEDVIKWSVKQRMRFLLPEWEAKISAAMSPLVRSDISEDEWEHLNKILSDTLMDEAVAVFKNALEEAPDFNNYKKLSDISFLTYLKNFWSYETSEYVKAKNLKKNYVVMNYNSIHYWSIFKNKALKDITKSDMQLEFEKLSQKEISSSRINSIMKVALIPLKVAYKEGLTINRAFEYLLPKVENNKKMYTDTFAVQVFNTKWTDTESFVANLIGHYGKMQLQEVRALRLCDIYTDGYITSKNIFVNELSENKNARIVKLPSLVMDILLKYISSSPYKDFKETDYVFFSSNRNRPARAKKWSIELNSVCKSLGFNEFVSFGIQ